MPASPFPWRPGLPAVVASELYWGRGSLGLQQAGRAEHGGWVELEKESLCKEALHEARGSVRKQLLRQHLWLHAIIPVAAQQRNDLLDMVQRHEHPSKF